MKPIFVFLYICMTHASFANDQMRDWTLASGEKIPAEIIGFDEETRIVSLRDVDEKTIKLDESNFTAIDQAWILQWVEQLEEAQALLAKIGGTVTRHTTTGAFATTYSLYVRAAEPSAVAEKPPLLFLFHPGGEGGRAIYSYVEMAATLGVTLVSFDHFKNTDNNPEREAEMLQRFTAILPKIEATVAHDEKRMFMSGTSGGAWRSYHYSAQVPRPWAGILASGGWLGGEQWFDLPYPRMRVAMVNGDKDHAANDCIKKDTEILHRAGSSVSVHAFEGGHQMPPPAVLIKALRWLLETTSPDSTIP